MNRDPNTRPPRRRWLWRIGLVLVATLAPLFAALFYQPAWLVDGLERLAPGVVFRVHTDQPLVALTIDDGPDDAATPQVLDVLRREGVRATFFIIGERARRYPAMLRAIAAGGHQLGNHLWVDSPEWVMDDASFRHDLDATEALVRQPDAARVHRPAAGLIRSAQRRAAEALGYTVVLGSAYANDVFGPPRAYIRWALARMARPGAILIIHVGPGRERTADVLPGLIRAVRAKGLRFVTVGELLAARRRD